MNSRERVIKSINHLVPDRVPIDFGGTLVTGISAGIVSKLREFYKLENSTPVKIIEPYQILGEIADDLKESLGVDVIGLSGKNNMFGFENSGWKKWELFDGTAVLVPQKFNTIPREDGSLVQYPQGDNSVPPSARLPRGGFYFDSIIRQQITDYNNLNVNDNLEEFSIIDEEELRFIECESEHFYKNTNFAIAGNFGGMSFGDIALVPAPSLKNPKGIRDIEEWYISLMKRKEFVKEIFANQCEISLKNIELIYQAVANRIQVIIISATDFGTQNAPFIPVTLYNEIFKPFHLRLNSWVHKNTSWKTFMHSCGSIENLIPEFIDAGFDILNPVQLSAQNMDAVALKEKYGDKIVFWGGGVDTQKTLPFGSKEEVEVEVKSRLEVFSKGGGFVFSSIHNIQPKTPVENIATMIEIVKNFRIYDS